MPSNLTNVEGLMYISDVVNSFKASKGDNTRHLFIKYLHWALKGYRELNLGLALEPRTAYVKLDHLKRVNLLALRGYRSLVKVGVLRGDRIVVFIPDSSISKIYKRTTQPFNEQNTPYRDSFDATDANWFEIMMANFVDADGNYRFLRGFGQNHNGYGYFTFDRQMGQLLFSAETRDEGVYVEYIADAYTVGSKTMVPQVIADYLEEFIRWSESRQKNGDAATETEARSIVMKDALMKVIMRTDNLSLDSIQDIVLRGMAKI